MAVKTFTTGEVLTAADTNTYLNNGGLVYITTTNFTGGTSAFNTANVFTSTYTNYRIVLDNLSSGSGYENLRFRFTQSAVAVTTPYYYGITYVTWAGATGFNNLNGGANSYGLVVNVTNTANQISGAVIDVYRPQKTTSTGFSVVGQGSDASWAGNGYLLAASSVDGIIFYLPTGYLTGTARFYGYREL